MWNLLVFAVIGLFVGAASRLLYPDRRAMHILGSMLIGMIGALMGGMVSWSVWPAVTGEFQTGNLVSSVFGGMMLIVLWAGVAYKRRLRGYTNKSP